MMSTRSVFALVSLSAFVVGCADPKVPVQETKVEPPKVEARRVPVDSKVDSLFIKWEDLLSSRENLKRRLESIAAVRLITRIKMSRASF